MNLDELHKVMKGDMTVDQACEGMTDDFEIGHVSHRADGDYRKVAQGKWVPVKAAGQGQMGAKAKPDEYDKNSLLSKQDNEELLEGRRSSANRLRGQSDSWEGYLNILKEDKANGYDVDREIERVTEKVKAESAEKPAEQKGGVMNMPEPPEGKVVQKTFGDYNFVVGKQKGDGEPDYYQFQVVNQETGSEPMIINAASWDEAKAKMNEIVSGGEDKVRKENMERRITDAYKSILEGGEEDVYFSESNESGAKRMLRDDYGLTPTEIDRVYELLRYTHNGKQEREEGERAEAAARRDRAYNNERYGVNQLEDAAPRLTRDTKIRLSQVKR